MNFWDIVILLAVGAGVVFGIRRMRGRKAGSCGCGCDNCPGCGQKKT